MKHHDAVLIETVSGHKAELTIGLAVDAVVVVKASAIVGRWRSPSFVLIGYKGPDAEGRAERYVARLKASVLDEPTLFHESAKKAAP